MNYLKTTSILVLFLTLAFFFGLNGQDNNASLPQSESEVEAVGEGTIGYPLKGFIGYTNTGTPIRGMKVECFVDGWKKRVASTKTDSNGNFSFPQLPEGKYHLKASLRGYFSIKTIVTTTKGSKNVLSLITEGK